MFAQLPELIKKEVLYYLQLNDFPKAKAVHDAWVEINCPPNCSDHIHIEEAVLED